MHPVGTDSALEDFSLAYRWDEVKSCCDNFSKEATLGQGSYGTVYKGVMPNGTEVACKVLNNPQDAGFLEEVNVLSRYRHPNLITLMGFSRGPGGERVLIYEYLCKGDFAQCMASFNGYQRLSVLLDASLGLSQLHSMTPKAFHRDIKTPNILISANGIAKISDFGLSKVARGSFQVTSTSGTIGYADPEYVRSGVVSEDSEVYSFGMVRFQIIN